MVIVRRSSAELTSRLGVGGAGKPTAKVIAEVADMYAFAAKALGASWQAGRG